MAHGGLFLSITFIPIVTHASVILSLDKTVTVIVIEVEGAMSFSLY